MSNGQSQARILRRCCAEKSFLGVNHPLSCASHVSPHPQKSAVLDVGQLGPPRIWKKMDTTGLGEILGHYLNDPN